MSAATDAKNPKIGVRGATIITRSGYYVDFLDPNPATIHIGDIAWGLGYTCRFAGQTLAFYSVAQHSVLVSQIVPPDLARAALLHDAAEAYIGDVTRPLKQLLPDYKAIEKRMEHAIAARFDLPLEMDPEIKRADLRLLRTEQRDLTQASQHHWQSTTGFDPLTERIEPLAPDAAARLFLARWRELEKVRAP